VKRIPALRFFVITTVALIAWTCSSSLKVSSDYDKKADFSRYRTFALFNPENLHEAISQMNQSRIFTAIRNEMAKKGFEENVVSPDLLVNTTAFLKDRVSVSGTDTYMYGSVYRPYTWGPGVSGTNYDTRHYKDGSIVIDIVEAGSKKLLWQGTGNREIDAPVKNPDTEIPKAISAIMEKFPPGNVKSK
jgi:hypothetical protein